MELEDQNENVQVTITHPDGVKMRYSESISAFLMSRKDKSRHFYLGHWLSSLGDDDLGQLIQLSQLYLDGVEERYLDDIFMVVITAVSAEKRNPKVELSPEILNDVVGALNLAACIESFTRRGWLVLENTLSINIHKKVKARITDSGMKQGGEFRKMFH